MDICEGSTLAYTVSGPKLTPGAVSDVNDFSLLAKQVVSGAVAAKIEGWLSSVPFATLSLCAQVALTLKAKKTSKLLILNAHRALWNGTLMDHTLVNPWYKLLNYAYVVVQPHVIRAVSSSREIWPKILITPLVIISIHLEGMADIPSHMVYHHLHSWLGGNIVHIDMDFNLDDIPRNDFGTRLSNMLDRLETGDLQRYVNFCLIILMLIFYFI